MRAIVLEKFGGLDSLVYRDIPDPEPRLARGDRNQGVWHQPRRDAYALGRMGRSRAGERHRMRGPCEILSRRGEFPVGAKFESAIAPVTTGVQGLRRGRQ